MEQVKEREKEQPSKQTPEQASEQAPKQTPEKKPPVAKKPVRIKPKKASGGKQTPDAPKAKKKSRLSESEKRGAQTLMAILVVALGFYLLIVLIIALLVWYSVSTPAESPTLYSVRIVTESDGQRQASYSAEEANNSYGLYLRYSDIAPLCEFGIAGDGDRITLYLPGDGLVGNPDQECIVLSKNSSLVEVNGNFVRLAAPVLFEGEDYLLPVSLFETYLLGLNVEYDDESNLCIVTVPERLSFRLLLHRPKEAEPPDLTLLPEESTPEEPMSEE